MLSSIAPQELFLVAVVTVAAVWDIHAGRIPNWLTYPAWAFGFAFATAASGWSGLLDSSIGFGVGFIPFLILYSMGGMGGGDVKLMGAVGAVMGYPFVLNAMISAILVGGAIAVLIVIWEGRITEASKYVGTTIGRVFYRGLTPVSFETRQKVPFGVAICLGTLLALVTAWKGYNSPVQLFLA